MNTKIRRLLALAAVLTLTMTFAATAHAKGGPEYPTRDDGTSTTIPERDTEPDTQHPVISEPLTPTGNLTLVDDVLQERIKIGVCNGEMKIKLGEKKLDFDETFTIIKTGGNAPSLYGLLIISQNENGDTGAAILPIPNETDYKALCLMLYKIYKRTNKTTEIIKEIVEVVKEEGPIDNMNAEGNGIIIIDVPVEEGDCNE